MIINDTFAYIFGISFGKTKLIELSPKKTWEGFIGGIFSTLVAAFLVINLSYNNIIHEVIDANVKIPEHGMPEK